MNAWRYVGAVIQGCGLGLLLLMAILVLLGFDADARLFRYQGY
jgi:hypothetical protein